MDDTKFVAKPRRVAADLLPNEQEASYESILGFLICYRIWILGLSVVVLMAGVLWMVWRFQENQILKQADSSLAAAQSLEALQEVVEKYSGTRAALLAAMDMGDLYFQKGAWDQAVRSYQQVVDRYPESPLVPSALMGQATILEIQGKVEEALKVYRSISSTHNEAFQAPQAQFAGARLLETTGRFQEARKMYEDLIADHPKSAWKREAEVRLQKVSLLLKNNPQKSGK